MPALPQWIRIVRDPSKPYIARTPKRPITGPRDIWKLVRNRARREEVEVFYVIVLNTQNRVIAVQEIARGTLDACVVHPREIFRAAILLNASRVILAHNHPSGNAKPSDVDIKRTKIFVFAGLVLGIYVLDHIVIGTKFVSMARKHLLEFPSGKDPITCPLENFIGKGTN